MTDMDRILLNQATIMRSLWMILGAIALERGADQTDIHKQVAQKLMNAAQEAEDYALRNEYTIQ